MVNNFDKILDECIDRINSGESVESCLADYSSYSEQLKPLLQAIIATKKTYTFLPSKDVKTAAKRSFEAALEKHIQQEKQPRTWLSSIFGKPLAWATVATAIAAIIGLYFGLNQVFYPISPIVPSTNPEGNFILLISDDVNAINDFESVNISISKVGLYSSDTRKWIEFEPEIQEVDLTILQGEKTQQVWRGDIPVGEYSKIFIYVDDIRGVLKENIQGADQPVEIKLPSNKLQISKSFQITAGEVTSFIYDLTVIATGNEQSGIRYILKPQIDESGTEKEPADNKGKSKQD
jgi:hypothetical protein